jgi:hypothetical protein
METKSELETVTRKLPPKVIIEKMDRIHIMIKKEIASYPEDDTCFRKKMKDFYEKQLSVFYLMVSTFGKITDELVDQCEEAKAGLEDMVNHPFDDLEKEDNKENKDEVIDLTLPDNTDPDFIYPISKRVRT